MRIGFRTHNNHGESGGVDDATLAKQMANLRQLLSSYAPNDIYNADEFAFYYQMDSTTKISPGALPDLKKAK